MYLIYKNFFRKTKGFTLIEVLVVIAIIGIMASVVLLSVTSIRAKVRDSTRMSNIKQITNALFLVANKNNTFPAAGDSYAKCIGAASCWAGYGPVSQGGAFLGDSTLDAELKEFLPVLPLDPLNGQRTKGDAYLYVNSSGTVQTPCSPPQQKGPAIVWIPDLIPAVGGLDCKGLGGNSCWGNALGNVGYYCTVLLQ